MITLIAAAASNNVIGKDNQLIWRVPGDLKRFKELTTGNIVVMGRKTFDSIGRPLPDRTNIILSRDKNLEIPGCLIYNSLEEILSLFEKSNVWVIGGGEIYQLFLPYADKIELTRIHKQFDGDSYFPELDSYWIEVAKQSLVCDFFAYDYITYEKKTSKS